MGRKANSLRDSEIAANQRELAAGLIPSGRIRLWPQRRLHSRAMGVMLRPEFNKRKEVIQCRVGPWRWWWQADAEPAGSEQFRAEWLHSATRKLRATKTWQPPFRLGRARGLAAPPAQPSQFSRKAAATRPSLRLGNRTIEVPFDPPIATVGNSTMVRTHAPAGLDVVGRRTIS